MGKTFLVRTIFDNQFAFQLTGIANVTKAQQLLNFHSQLQKYQPSITLSIPKNWFLAFQQLTDYLEQSKEEKKIIFLDELPWLDKQKSDFITSLEHFWNSRASARNEVLLIVCCSAERQQT